MSQYNETVSSDDKELGISLKDLFISILLCWKAIIISMLICALIGCGFAYLKSGTQAPLQPPLESARAQLSEEQRSDVESLYALYQGYHEYLLSLQDKHARYLSSASQISDYGILNVSYYLTSSLEDLETILPQMLLSEEDYNALRSICAEEDPDAIYRRVRITCSDRYEVSGAVTDSVSEATESPASCFILVTLCGSSEEECTAMLEVADSAIKRTADSLREIDHSLLLQIAGKQYSHNADEFVFHEVAEHEKMLIEIEKQIVDLKKNWISAQSDPEKNYYDLLSAEAGNISSQPSKNVSWGKWTAVGAFSGFFLGIGFCFLQYLTDGTIKTPEESEWLFRTRTLQSVFLPGKRNLFGKWVSRFIGADQIPMMDKAALLAADLQLLMEKAGYHRLYLFCDPHDENACRFASVVKEMILQEKNGVELLEGNPCMSAAELEKFSTVEAAVIFTEIRHSSSSVQADWNELCSRYQLPVLGSAAVRVCW